jgi:hypothetical protein
VVLQQTTQEIWASERPFEACKLQGLVQRDIPELFFKRAEWWVVNGIERYYAKSNTPEESGEPDCWYPVEFNTEHLCWVEIHWIENLEIGGHWQAFCIAREDLGLDITAQDTANQDQLECARRPQEMIDETPTMQTSTPSTNSRASTIQVRSPAPQRGSNQIIALQLAESLHIQDPVMSRTMTMEPTTGVINPHTGHMEMPMNPDDVALYRAISPDQLDLPTNRERRASPRIPFGWPRGRPLGQGPGGGPFGGGLPGGPPMPMPHAPQQGGHHSNKLVGNHPIIFTGDRSKVEQFITQGQLYEGVNITNVLMHNPYQQAMFFLMYIQGTLVNEWVKGVNAWLCTQAITQGWATTDECLWNGVIGAFNRQYADVMEQEKAQAELGRGLCMQQGDLDILITRFEQLVCHANYDMNQPLVLQIFTDVLPHTLYEFIFKNIQLCNYEGWHEATIQQQKVFIHMKSRLEKFNPKQQTAPKFGWKPSNWWQGPSIPNLMNPIAMDLTPGRIHIAEQEDFEPGKNQFQPPTGGSQEGGNCRDLFHNMDKGKSSLVSTVAKLAIFKGIVNNCYKGDPSSHKNNTHLVPDKWKSSPKTLM